MTSQPCRALPAPVPDLRAPGLRQLVLAGGALGRRARGVRASTWPTGTSTARPGTTGSSAPRPRGRRSPGSSDAEPDEVAVTTSESAGVSALASALDFGGERPKVVISGLRVPDDRPDLARAGAARRRGRARPASGRRSRSRLRRGDRRADGARLDHGGLLPERRAARRRGDRRARPRRAARWCCSTPTRRSGSYPLDVRALGVDFLGAGVLKYLLGVGRARLLLVPAAGSSSELRPTQTGWFADRDIFAMDIRDYSPSPTRRGGSSRARRRSRALRRHRRHRADAGDRDRRDPRARERPERAADRRRRRSSAGGGDAARPERRGALVCVRSTDAPALVAALGADGIVTSSRDGNLRISAHAYNTVEDIDAVLESLDAPPAPARVTEFERTRFFSGSS